MIIAIS